MKLVELKTFLVNLFQIIDFSLTTPFIVKSSIVVDLSLIVSAYATVVPGINPAVPAITVQFCNSEVG